MNKKDIIDAAFRVWGRDYYRNPSLSSLAKELNVSKPALYRHFLCKEALTKAMFACYFDKFADYIRDDMEKAFLAKDPEEGFFIIYKTIAGFYARNCHALIFSLMNFFDRKLTREIISEEIKARGINTDMIKIIFEKAYDNQPGLIQLVFTTLTFFISNFHKMNNSLENPNFDEEKIDHAITSIYEIIKNGLRLPAEKAANLDFDKLEKLDDSKIQSDNPGKTRPIDTLFKGVAEAVAEAGPWNASMEMVAKKMGLSKSSLYGHFKDKKDMMRRLFISEFKRIMDFARQGVSLSSDTAEQLYLCIYSIAFYLNSRPEILIAIDWIRTRRLDLGKPNKDNQIFMLFNNIDIESLRDRSEENKQLVSGWILFLLAGALQNNTNIRVLYKFISLGLGGFAK